MRTFRPATLIALATLLKAAPPSDINSLYPGIEKLYIDLHANPVCAEDAKVSASRNARHSKTNVP